MQKDQQNSDLEFWKRMNTLIGDERPYPWAERVGINRSAFQSAKTRGNKPLPKTLKDWAGKIGCSYEWLNTGVGEPFSNTSKIATTKTIEKEGLTITTALEQDKLQQAFETTETTLENQHRTMQPTVKAEFIVMLYTALVNQQTQNFNQHLLQTIIFEVENQLEILRRTMSPEKKTLLIMAIYTLYSGDASNNEAIQQTTIQLIRSAA